MTHRHSLELSDASLGKNPHSGSTSDHDDEFILPPLPPEFMPPPAPFRGGKAEKGLQNK